MIHLTHWQKLTVVFVAAGVALAAGAAEYSWQQPHAKVVPTGDLEWAPKPFAFQAGESVKYIDYENGDDANPGTKAKPWKHHPWDAAAGGEAGTCSGVHTYVFKRGVTYRGKLVCRESGKPGHPIRLTSDPSWGEGEAVLCGSQPVTGWKKGADRADIPEAGKVWSAKLPFATRSVWMVEGGEVTRLKLARTPNWEISNPDDVKSEWWTWENPRWWAGGGHKTTGKGGKKIHLGIDRKHLTKDADHYVGGIVWSEWGIVMGTPFPSRIETYDAKQKGIGFQGFWYGDSGIIIRNNRYFLEDKPHYLDEPGEYWFDKTGRGGTLYVRLPGEKAPTGVRIEAAKEQNLIDSPGMSHVHVAGLTFRFLGTRWNYWDRPFQHPDLAGACVRLLGTGRDVRVSHCVFEHVTRAVRIKAAGDHDELDDIHVTDNDMRELDHGAIQVADSSRWGKKAPPFGPLGHVEVLRNRLYRVGLRPARSENGHALVVNFPRTAEIAGNVLDRCWGAGLFIFGGKGSGQLRDLPMTRILIHHNKVTDPLLNTNDWGGIETWQGGPIYVYDNVSGNPGGYWNWAYNPKQPAKARFGHAYYLDGAFKNYHFNNIAWGKSKDPYSKLGNTAAFQEIHSYQNTFFNNTAYNFVKGTRRQSPHAGRDKFLGNVWQGIGEWLFWHASPAKSEPEGNAAHAGPQKEHFDYYTNAYANNVFHDVSKQFAVFETSGRWLGSLAEFSKALVKHKALAATVGTMSEKPVLQDAKNHDFRPAAGTPAIDGGVKAFVPWSLYGVVGEWNFTRSDLDPTVVIDEHWYMTPYHVSRTDYYTRPMYPLKGVGIGADDYVDGALEDWTVGALRLDGKSKHLVLTHEKLAEPFPMKVKGKPAKGGWAEVALPVAVAPGQKFPVKVTLPETIEGQKVAAHLHWLKKDGWGGFNAWGGLPKDAKKGTHTFTFPSAEKDGLDKFSLLVYLSPTGEFKDKTRSESIHISRAGSEGELKMKSVSIGAGKAAEREVGVRGEALRNPQVHSSNFLIEAYVKPEAGASGTIAAKMGEAGYALTINADGVAELAVKAPGREAKLAGKAKLADGKWHHVIAEADRKAGTVAIYVDGKRDATDKGLASEAGSLANEADLVVGKGLACTLDFLRIALGTIADAETTIEELHTWQFDGPFLRDFTGKKPADGKRDAGALERQ